MGGLSLLEYSNLCHFAFNKPDNSLDNRPSLELLHMNNVLSVFCFTYADTVEEKATLVVNE